MMQFRDKDGDVWESDGEGRLRCVRANDPDDVGLDLSAADVDEDYGPLTPAAEEPSETPSAPVSPLFSADHVLSRASVFQSAHALVTGLAWGEEQKPSVYDVLQVARFLEES
ncbi:hypothetical protein [Streptomyces sp. DH12]|uniref:hypothetical protein n=1 Tax=Streptomyces sp. DH12 TaxID=2857010 RepID=UPI001E51EB66|nr:hypothetical protein [Streptomyces sp. DH12]